MKSVGKTGHMTRAWCTAHVSLLPRLQGRILWAAVPCQPSLPILSLPGLFFSGCIRTPLRAVTGLPGSGKSMSHHPEGLLLRIGGLGSGTGPRSLREGRSGDLSASGWQHLTRDYARTFHPAPSRDGALTAPGLKCLEGHPFTTG